jgi:hypothetical protein
LKKIGENQIIQFFSNALQDEIREKFGRDVNYSFGNFAGQQDKKFADFFAGTNSKNILIEFKEYEHELKAELKKPLRKKLCYTLNKELSTISRKCHFAAWNEKESDIFINLVPYIDEICRRFIPGLPEDVKNLLIKNQPDSHEMFITKFLTDERGVSHAQFKAYINYLSNIAQSRDMNSFEAILYSRNNSGKLIGTKFSNLDEAFALTKLKPPKNEEDK